jgi:capsule polysaccharide export protein KpsC/LpsZ
MARSEIIDSKFERTLKIIFIIGVIVTFITFGMCFYSGYRYGLEKAQHECNQRVEKLVNKYSKP